MFLKKYSVCFIPVFLSFALVFTYLFAPDFYLQYILSGLNREAQAVEMLTFTGALLASFVLFKNAYNLYLLKEYRWSVWLLLIIGAATFFFAGEESSWGQSYFYWKTPEFYDCTSLETNIHNTDIPIQSLGSVFLLLYFVALPFLWWKKIHFPDRISIELAIPESQIVLCMLYAFGWKLIKNYYRTLYSREYIKSSSLYINFIDQINEQKEFLVVVAILIYAFHVDLKVLKRLSK